MGCPVLRFAVRETGEIEVLSPWFPHICIDQGVIDAVGPPRLQVTLEGGADVLTFQCVNGRGSYVLGPPDEHGARLGRLWRHS